MASPLSPSPSSSFRTSSPSRQLSHSTSSDASPCVRVVASDGCVDEAAPTSAMAIDFIQVPVRYQAAFDYLNDTQLFFFGVLRKLNRIRAKDRRVCFVTDYTINIAACGTGKVNRCSKVEDVAELVTDPRARCVGIRMRARPYYVTADDYLHWNCFYEMPVDLLLFTKTEDQLEELVQVLCCVYTQCTGQPLPCRCREPDEEWEAMLVLWPDGSRVKKDAMCYHKLPPPSSDGGVSSSATPQPSTQSTSAACVSSNVEAAAALAGAGQGEIDVPQSRGARWVGCCAAGRHAARDASWTASPPARPPQRRHKLPRPHSSPPSEPAHEAVNTPSRTPAARAVETHSATRRAGNPLSPSTTTGVCDSATAASAAVVTTRPDVAPSTPVRPNRERKPLVMTHHPHHDHQHTEDEEEEPLVRESTSTLLYSPRTPAPLPRQTDARERVAALEDVVEVQQLYIRELRRSRYSKECELDDLRRHLQAVTSHESSPRQPRVTIPGHHHSRTKTSKAGLVSAAEINRNATASRSHLERKAHSPNHEAHLSSVKPIHTHVHRRHRHDGEADRTVNAEKKLKEALRHHRRFEETVWAYYKMLPPALQSRLGSYQDGHADQHASQSTARELRYLQELVRQSQRAGRHSSRSASADVAVPTSESLTMVADQIDAFAVELARKQAEIDSLRHQLREDGTVRVR